ncbi:MAG: ATP-binding protein [Sandaracinaceae bacterium]|nr:ATP-binding protein [Sandaracinaceae bacterium]
MEDSPWSPGDPGSGKSIALRVLEERLRRRQDLIVGTIERPIGRASDFYRETGDIFGVSLHGHNRWAGFKTLREKWSEHIATTLTRPVLIVDEAQEMISGVFTELRLSRQQPPRALPPPCRVFAGDGRLPVTPPRPPPPPRLRLPAATQTRARWS